MSWRSASARQELGEVVPPGDVSATAEALLRVVERGRDAYRPGLDRAAAELAWPEAVRPLVAMLRAEPPPRGVIARAAPLASAPERALSRGRLPLNLVGVRDWPRL